MSAPSWSAVDDYIVDRLIGEDAVLEAALANNRRAGLPPIDVSAAQGKLLQLLAKGVGAKRILEIGTLGGYSTIWLARALGEGGRLVTLELDPGYAAVAGANIDRAGLGDPVDIRIGPACDTLAAMVAGDEAAFDFVFVDADKENYAAYLDHAVRLARPGAMLVFDNVVREGGIIDISAFFPLIKICCVEGGQFVPVAEAVYQIRICDKGSSKRHQIGGTIGNRRFGGLGGVAAIGNIGAAISAFQFKIVEAFRAKLYDMEIGKPVGAKHLGCVAKCCGGIAV